VTEQIIQKREYIVGSDVAKNADTSNNQMLSGFRVHRSVVHVTNVVGRKELSSVNSALRARLYGEEMKSGNRGQ
jgi:hypothetical protein